MRSSRVTGWARENRWDSISCSIEASALVIDDASIELPSPAPEVVRVRSGPLAGAEGTWAGLAGPRRFPAGVTLEAAFVRFGGRPPVAVPIGDLERFA